MKQHKVTLYSLSTCAYCNAIRKMFTDLEVEHTCFEADTMDKEERNNALKELKKINPKCSFPTVVIDDMVITGYQAQEIKEQLGIRTEVDDMFDLLRRVNEEKGYFLNRNKEKTYELLRSLLINKDRYGYMACPCRLASGDREQDKDIFCPCDYREADVAEFGSCYCGLYVSADWNTGVIEHTQVPERRSPDLM